MASDHNLSCHTTILQHWRPEQIQLDRAADHQMKLWSILISRALSEHFCRTMTCETEKVCSFQLWSILISRALSENICRKLTYKKGLANELLIFRALSEHIRRTITCEKETVCGQFQLWSILICKVLSENICCKPIFKKGPAKDQFQLLSILIWGVISDLIIGMENDLLTNLPVDIQCIILSRLSLKEAVRTSAVSRKWRYLWKLSPRLGFDALAVCGEKTCGKQEDKIKFISSVYAVLLQCRGRVVEELAIKFDFDTTLVGHLNNWVTCAVSLWTKSLAFDLAPDEFIGRKDRYMFPLKLFDKDSICGLEKIQLSFVSLEPPPKFNGFPSLRKLDLNLVHMSGKDLSEMLSNCQKIKYLRIVKCHLNDELLVKRPLPYLENLIVSDCEVTKIALDAVKLRTFVYDGEPVPIELNRSSELEDADVYLFRVTLEHGLAELVNMFTNVRKLTFHTFAKPATMPYLMYNPWKFSLLKHLELILLIKDDAVNLSLVSFLRSAPFIEKFVMHHSVLSSVHFGEGPIRTHPAHPYKYLKNVYITGFIGSIGQREFLLHIVENAPALKVLTIDYSDKYLKKRLWEDDESRAKYVASIHRAARSCLQGKISPRCSLELI
ncbi:hypothetical protein ACP4OV_003049 [Aristida adscensionis]